MHESNRCVVFAAQTMLALAVISLLAARVDASDVDVRRAAGRVTQIIAHRGASAERPECTLAAIERAIESGATAVEIDVRTSKDGRLFVLHDATLDRTTNGQGPASELTLAELQQLDAGSWFDPSYHGQRIPSLIEAAKACRRQIDLLLDLKEQGDEYDRKVAKLIKEYGDPGKTIVGVRSVAQAERFRRLLPKSKQLGLIPSVKSIEEFAKAGVDTIRLWPRWLGEENEPVRRVRATGKGLHLNGTMGELDETLNLLFHGPDSLSSDHPARLRRTLKKISRNDLSQSDSAASQMEELVRQADGTNLLAGESRIGSTTFSNRDYRMLELPSELVGLPRYLFDGGTGDRVRLKFRQPAVVFAAFEYNTTGMWSFADGQPPSELGWQEWRENGYRGSSNSLMGGKPHYASIWYREFKPGQELAGLPRWWLCLGVADLETAKKVEGFKAGLTSNVPAPPPRYSHLAAAARARPLMVPSFDSKKDFVLWQTRQRKRFIDRMLYAYDGKIALSAGPQSSHAQHRRQEFRVTLDGEQLFRFFRLEPTDGDAVQKLPTIVCFMGHGTVAQILDEDSSYQQACYQQACAAQFADSGYLVYAMENVGMGPEGDSHLDLDQSLRLEGHGWYSLLFAHQEILLDHVFADPRVDSSRVASTGVSTGGLLALTAAAIEPRITAASVQGIFGSMRVSFIQDRHRHCRCGAIPGLLPEFDLPELALLIAPRPLHVSNGADDGFSPAEARRCLELISSLYRESGGKQPRMNVSPGGHEYSYEAAQEFFEEALNQRTADVRVVE